MFNMSRQTTTERIYLQQKNGPEKWNSGPLEVQGDYVRNVRLNQVQDTPRPALIKLYFYPAIAGGRAEVFVFEDSTVLSVTRIHRLGLWAFADIQRSIHYP